MADILRAVKGMNDILPASVPRSDKLPDSALWHWFEKTVSSVLGRYGYQYLVTPVVEPTALFVRGLGEVTDIVEKEMYSFVDAMNGDELTLRPEATAGIVRAMVEHNALYNGPLRLWTMGPMFRHERPQKGRYRQFHQLDVEALGYPGPDVDAEMILMARTLWRELGLVEASTCGSSSTAWASPTSAAPIARRSCATSSSMPRCSTTTRDGACTAIRCASWTRRTRRCRPLSTALRT